MGMRRWAPPLKLRSSSRCCFASSGTRASRLCTPHLGYVEKSTYDSYYGAAIDGIVGFAAGKPLNVLNPEALAKK